MIHVDIDEAGGRIRGVVSSADGGVEAFAGWLELVALIEAARAGSARALGSFLGEWPGASDKHERP